MHAAPENVDASSSGGGVTVTVPKAEGGYNVDASAAGGGTTVDVNDNPASTHRITARSAGGGITVAYAG
jgi:hypothetical protein